MAKKLYDLPEDAIDIIHQVMEESGLKFEVDAVRHIISEYKNKEVIADLVYEKLKDDFTRLRLGVRTAERNSIVIKDVFNTMLYEWDPKAEITCMAAEGVGRHKMILDSETAFQKKIERLKQVRDNEKQKKGEE